MEVHDQVEGGGVLEGIVKRGQPRTSRPSHDVTLFIEEGSLVTEEGRKERQRDRDRDRERVGEAERERERERYIVSK